MPIVAWWGGSQGWGMLVMRINGHVAHHDFPSPLWESEGGGRMDRGMICEAPSTGRRTIPDDNRHVYIKNHKFRSLDRESLIPQPRGVSHSAHSINHQIP